MTNFKVSTGIRPEEVRILGCFYSHNVLQDKTYQASLDSIQTAKDKALDPEKVDIVMCTWRKQGEHSFQDIRARHHIGTHIGIFLQIMQVFEAVEAEGKQFDIVCFLEHDVLYSPAYFKMVAEAYAKTRADVIHFRNYIGINEGGFVGLNEHHHPQHQASYRYGFYRDGLLPALLECAQKGVSLLEFKSDFMVEIQDEEVVPSVHIYTKRNLTSHYDIYKKTGEMNHLYWGSHKKYIEY